MTAQSSDLTAKKGTVRQSARQAGLAARHSAGLSLPTMMRIEVWREIGGHTSCVKYRNRWMFLTGEEGIYLLFLQEATRRGYSICRTQGIPGPVERAFQSGGNCLASLRQGLPQFKWFSPNPPVAGKPQPRWQGREEEESR